jgi:ribonuclease VapC
MTMKNEARTRLNENGRLVIPASFRKALGINPGDEVILRLEDDELRLTTLKHRIARAQRNARKYVPRGVSLADELLAGAVASTVNLAEVQTKLVTRGWPSEMAWQDANGPINEAVTFELEHARIAGDLVSTTKHLGLSLGDRACLALAIALNAPVYTTDKSWKNLKLNVPIHVIR